MTFDLLNICSHAHDSRGHDVSLQMGYFYDGHAAEGCCINPNANDVAVTDFQGPRERGEYTQPRSDKHLQQALPAMAEYQPQSDYMRTERSRTWPTSNSRLNSSPQFRAVDQGRISKRLPILAGLWGKAAKRAART